MDKCKHTELFEKHMNKVLAHNDEVFSLRSRTIDELVELVLFFSECVNNHEKLVAVLRLVKNLFQDFDLITNKARSVGDYVYGTPDHQLSLLRGDSICNTLTRHEEKLREALSALNEIDAGVK